jgi:glutamate racemase
MTSPIGIFDSGIGGLSILKALQAELPNEHFIYVADSGHAPYGEQGNAHVMARSLTIAAYLVARNIKALVVACNTATAAAIDALRAAYPHLPIVGVEPALKPAVAASKTQHIAVMATRGTLASVRFAALLAPHAEQARFTLLACDGLALAIEQSAEHGNATELIAACARIMGAAGIFGNQCIDDKPVDTIVLGCTHYAFAAQHIARLAGADVALLDNSGAVARQTRRLLKDSAATQAAGIAVEMVTTGHPAVLSAASLGWLGLQTAVRARDM